MAKKITNTKAAWEYLGQLFEMCEHFEFPAGSMLAYGLCDMLQLYIDDEILRRMLESRVSHNTIEKMADEMSHQSWYGGHAYLGRIGAGYAERALFCYLMAEVGTLPEP